MSHKVQTTIYRDTKPPRFQALCSCGWRSAKTTDRQAPEDEAREHHRNVERLRAQLKGQPTLHGQRDYYRAMGADPGNPEKDRVLWNQMADELDHRLNDAGADSEDQARLW